MSQDEILVGAAGQMFALVIPENGGFTEELVKFGSVKRGISGAATVDTQGARYQFTWAAEDISEDDASLLRQLYSQVRGSKKPVRLIIPHRKNLLTASASSARSVARHRESTTNYETEAGFAVVTTPEVLRPSQDPTYPLQPRLTRYVQIVNSSGSNDFVYPEGKPSTTPVGTPWSRLPLIEGRQYTCSILYAILAPGSQPNRLRNVWRNEDGGNSGAPSGGSLDLTATDWAWASITVTVPTGFPGFCPLIEIGSGATMIVAAMQVEEGPTRTPWVMGTGIPVVSFSSLRFTDTQWPLRNAELSMIEL